jgi:hypothetical protein
LTDNLPFSPSQSGLMARKARIPDISGPMHKLLHAAIASLIVLATSRQARALDIPDSPLLRTRSGLSDRA